MNLIAFGMTVLGVMLLLIGLFLVFKHRKTGGIVISLLGMGIVAVPFLVNFHLAR